METVGMQGLISSGHKFTIGDAVSIIDVSSPKGHLPVD